MGKDKRASLFLKHALLDHQALLLFPNQSRKYESWHYYDQASPYSS
jgi:hypothetical protein